MGGTIPLTGSAGSALQVPALVPGALTSAAHHASLDLLGGHDGERRRRRERGPAEGDAEDDGAEERHLLAELGRVLRPVAGRERALPHANPEGDSWLI